MFRFLLSKLFKSREKVSGEQVKPFLDHLEDLRWTIFKLAITLVVSMIGAFFWHKELIHLLEAPLRDAGQEPKDILFVAEYAGSFMLALSLSFYAGVVIAFPLLVWFLGEFILPALTPREKSYAIPAVIVGFCLFLGGAALCFNYIVPPVTKFMLGFSSGLEFRETMEARSYFKTVALMCIIFGMLCQVPVVMVTLNMIGIVTYKWIKSTRSYGYVGIFTLCAVVSPTPDIPSLLMFTMPIIGLYEICIWIIWFLDKRREKQLAKQEQHHDDDPHEPID